MLMQVDKAANVFAYDVNNRQATPARRTWARFRKLSPVFATARLYVGMADR
jgi:hypothetical protein